jgi:hypothetical protein
LFASWIDVFASFNQFDDVLDAIAGVAAIVARDVLDARWDVETLLDSQLAGALELDVTEAITRPCCPAQTCAVIVNNQLRLMTV